jgi:hypothetical protein
MFWGTEQANRHEIKEGPSAVFRELNETCRAVPVGLLQCEFPDAVPSRECNDVAAAPFHIRDACIHVTLLGTGRGGFCYTTDSVLEFPLSVGTSRTALRALSLAQNEAEIFLSSSDGVRMRGPAMFITTNAAAAAAAASLIVNCSLTTTTTTTAAAAVLTPLLLLLILLATY